MANEKQWVYTNLSISNYAIHLIIKSMKLTLTGLSCLNSVHHLNQFMCFLAFFKKI